MSECDASEIVTIAKIVPFTEEIPLIIPKEFIDVMDWDHPSPYLLIVATSSTQVVRMIPIKTDHVLKITAELDEINPDMIQDLGSLFASYGVTSLYSTGLCIQKERCLYELYTDPETLSRDYEQLRKELKQLEAVKDVFYEKTVIREFNH